MSRYVKNVTNIKFFIDVLLKILLEVALAIILMFFAIILGRLRNPRNTSWVAFDYTQY